jgi:hypothetical protein
MKTPAARVPNHLVGHCISSSPTRVGGLWPHLAARTLLLASGLTAVAPLAISHHPRANVVRGIYIHARDVILHGAWTPFKTPGQYVTDIRHSGEASLFCDNGNGGPGSGCGAGQEVALNQTEPRPIKIAGWSRAQGVQGQQGWQYSLYVDFQFTDGQSWPMKIATFSTGTHDWEYAETIITPPKPLKTARFYAFLREYPGKVWFDDLFFGEPDGQNLLRCPGFEKEGRQDTSAREVIFRQWADWHANAMHVYLSPHAPLWPSSMVESSYKPGESPLENFLADAAHHGIGVWTTPAPFSRRITSTNDPDFPQYYCPNSYWGQDWNAVLADLARFDFAGISLVPDEYNYNNGPLKQAFANHQNEEVRKFYQELPPYCDCPNCRRLFRQTHGIELPDLNAFSPTDPYRRYINFRYETTTRWLREAAATVKRVNPRCLADSLICVTPVCSDFWWGPGVAWDQVGYGSQIDFLTTDPYILLHNYLGDSTHWYVTETCLRLSGASPRHICGSVLEPCRLRQEYRELEPVEVYGAALTSVWHGAREVFYFHHVHITGRSGVAADPVQTQRNVAAAFSLLEIADPWLNGARPFPGIAVLHSRASEDWWRFYCQGLKPGQEPAGPTPDRPLTHPSADPRYASLAQVEPLMALLRCGLPTDLFYLDSVRLEELLPYPVILIPFPYAVPDTAASLIEKLAMRGKQVVIISEVGTLTQDGRLHDRPALLDVLGLQDAPAGHKQAPLDLPCSANETFSVYSHVAPRPGVRTIATAHGSPVLLQRVIGKGSVWFLAGEFGAGLPVDYSNWYRGHDRRVYPPSLNPGHLAVLLHALFAGGLPPAQWPRLDPTPTPSQGDDVEAAFMLNSAKELLVLLINWRADQQSVGIKLPNAYLRATYNARAVTPDGEVKPLPLRWDETGKLNATLAPQQAAIIRLLPTAR